MSLCHTVGTVGDYPYTEIYGAKLSIYAPNGDVLKPDVDVTNGQNVVAWSPDAVSASHAVLSLVAVIVALCSLLM